MILVKSACAALTICLIASVPATATTLFSDDFESGVSSSTWALATAGGNLLQGDSGGHHLGTQSAKQVNAFGTPPNDVYNMKTQSTAFTNPGTITAGMKEIAKVQFWDENIQTDASGDGTIQFGGAIMLAGSYGLSDFYQLGVNSGAVAGTTDITNYYFRTSLGGNVVSSVARTQGWHELRIEVLPYTGAGDVQFFIDNALVGSGPRRPNTGAGFDMNEIRLGLSIRTPDSPFWFDNVSLTMVPEPATLPLLGLGLGGLACCLRRRRRPGRSL